MSTPIIDVFLGGIISAVSSWTQTGYINLEAPGYEDVTYQTPGPIAAGTLIREVHVQIERRSNGPWNGVIGCTLHGTLLGPILATSPITITNSGIQVFTFNYTHTGGLLFVRFTRSINPSWVGYWNMAADYGRPLGGTVWYWNGVVWAAYLIDLKIKIRVNGWVNVSQYVNDMTIDIGKSDVDGEYVEGTSDITFNNRNGYFSPDNALSPYYGVFDINSMIKVEVTYNAIIYSLFLGFITRIRPSLLFDSQEVNITVLDRFSAFKDSEVTFVSSEGSSKTATQLITAIMQKLGLWSFEYAIDADPTVLANYTGTEKAFDLLNRIVEAGQHHHFMAGNGVYTFKNNQWLKSTEPDFEWDADPAECHKVDDIAFEYDVKGLKNYIVVEYTSGEAIAKDDESIYLYGKRTERMDNAFMPNSTYATGIANYILAMKNVNKTGVEFTIKNRWPDLFQLSLGKSIQYGETLYTIYGVQWKLNNQRKLEAVIRTKKWIMPPPTASWYDYTPFTITDYINNPNSVEPYRRSQSFILPASGKLLRFSFHHGSTVWPNSNNVIWIYAADVNGKPTGPILATSASTYVWYTDLRTDYNFSGANQINMIVGLRYAAVLQLDMPNPVGTYQWNLKGNKNNPYSDGKAYYSTDGGVTWLNFSTDADHWFSIRIQTP